MDVPGHVTLDGEVIGSFELDPEEKITIKFHRGASGVEETLEFASEHGMMLGLMLAPPPLIND